MIFVHIFIFAGCLLALFLERKQRLPPIYGLGRKELEKIFLLVIVGNFLGLCLTWQGNQNRVLQEGSCLERPKAGKGNDTKNLLVDTAEGQLEITLDIPQQEGAEKESAEEKEEKILSPQEQLREDILARIQEMNEAPPEEDKYYLPWEIDGQSLAWLYPYDNRGMMLAVLSIAGALGAVAGAQKKKQQEEEKKKEQMLRDYPNLVTKLCLMVQAGMTMRRAFAKTALDYRKNREKEESRYAYEEMLVTYYEMESGVLEMQAYENFGRRCGQLSYRTLATLLTQNLKKGGAGLLEVLERESMAAFEDRKRRARIQGEAAATKLLVPMVLMLVVVLIILLVPAGMAFYQA